MKKTVFALVFLQVIGQITLAKVPRNEKAALIDLYQSTNGNHWIKKWDLKAPVSEWYGIKVEDNHVVSINLFRNNLMGPIPETIGKLTHLKVLNLAFNNITGELPKEIGMLAELRILKLEMNRIKSKLPEDLGRLKKLEELTAFNNFFE